MKSISRPLKSLIKKALTTFGYAVRDVGRGVGGIKLLHDAHILLGDKANPTLFDVGANIGQTTLAFLNTFRSPLICAFEPSPKTFSVLQRALVGIPRVTV